MRRLRNPGPLIFTIVLSVMLSPNLHAQSALVQNETTPSSTNRTTNKSIDDTTTENSTQQVAAKELPDKQLPDAPGMQTGSQQASNQQSGSMSGTVLDANGAQIEDALVTLELTNSKTQHTTTTDSTGSYKFTAVDSGTFKLKIASKGFATWVSTDLVLQPGQNYEIPDVTLQIASAMTDVEVTMTQHDIAEEQINLEEKQRVLGVFPNFYVSYTWDAAPLTSGQKFRLALRTSYDPATIVIPAIIAGVEQSQNAFSGYGQGTAGYFRRYGAAYGDGFVGNMIGNAILPSLLHQDPRYFYKGTGTIRSRVLYAMSTAFICKGDNGHWQPNYSFIIGNFASAAISNAYYPASNRNGAGLTITNALIDTASGAASSLIQEFLIKKISRGVPKNPNP